MHPTALNPGTINPFNRWENRGTEQLWSEVRGLVFASDLRHVENVNDGVITTMKLAKHPRRAGTLPHLILLATWSPCCGLHFTGGQSDEGDVMG